MNARRVVPQTGAILAVAVLLLLAGRIPLMSAHFSLDPNEGWNALEAVRAVQGLELYPKPEALTGDNYPPLSFFVVGGLGELVGDMIFAGRIVALLSVLAAAALVVAIARDLCGGRWSGPVSGGLFFLGLNATLFRSYFGIDDPQWLGHAAMMAGLAVLVIGGDRAPLPPPRVAAAALLILAGALIKQNLVAVPLAISGWLTLHDRRALVVWVVTGGLGLLAASVLIDLAYGAAAFDDILSSERHYSLWRMVVRSAGPLACLAPSVLVASRLMPLRRSDRRMDLILLLVALSLPLGILQRSGQGVDRNAHFESLLALSLTTAVALDRWASRGLRVPLGWLGAAFAPFAVLVPLAAGTGLDDLRDRHERAREWQVMQDRVAATDGRVACQTLAFCYWAGKGFEVDFFLYGQRALRHGTARLERALADRRFAAVELDAAGPTGRGDRPNPAIAVVLQSMRPVLTDGSGRMLFVPWPPPSGRQRLTSRSKTPL